MDASNLVLRPIEWGLREESGHAGPVPVQPATCPEDLYRVINRHRKPEWIGVTLLRAQFPVGDDEPLWGPGAPTSGQDQT